MSNTTTVTERTVTPRSLGRLVKKAFKKKIPLMIWGPPGVGKSDIIWQVGKEQGRPVIDIRLLLMDPTDLKGIPYYNPETKKMHWGQPSDLPDPSEPDQGAIIFLDEINAAPPSVQAAAYQLILNRRIGTYHLPENSVLVAAGNRQSDKGVAYKMPTPLANRFTHCTLTVDSDDWNKWAIKNYIHSDVVGFLSSSEQDLFQFDPKSSSPAFPTPRTWARVSMLIDDDDDDTGNDDLTENELVDMVIGTVGEAAGVKFAAYRRQTSLLPKPGDILRGFVRELEDNSRVDIQYALSTNLCYSLDKELKLAREKGDLSEWYGMANTFIKFITTNFKEELIVLSARMAIKQFDLPFHPTKVSLWADFSERHQDLILEA